MDTSLSKDLTGNVLRRNFTRLLVTGGPQPKEYISPQGMQKVPPFDGMATHWQADPDERTLCRL